MGFVQSVVYCYRNHYNLVIRPDDVWTAIMVQFSLYVNKNAESLRSQFVNHEGQKELKVYFGPGIPIKELNYPLLVTKMRSLISDNLKSTSNWIIPDFTTTTVDDQVINGVVLMATMEKYFSYKFRVGCGIPNISLLGTAEDWKKLKDK